MVGDSIWDLLAAQRAGALSTGLLSGGYGSDELVKPPLQTEPGDRYNSRVVLTEGFVRPKKRRGCLENQHFDN
ncbi:MAG: hypothetical protein PVS2B1_17300 [Candidatus Dormibacteraceae bacterium]